MTADHSLDQPDLLVSAAGLSAAHTRMSEDEAERLVACYWGLPGHATRLATEKDDTFAVHADDHRAYVLKVTNPAEDPLEVDLEIQVMRHVARAGSLVPVPQLFDALDGQLLIALEDAAGQSRQARLMSFIAGTPLDSTSSSPAEREAVGRTLGRLRHLTSTFSHPAQHRVPDWPALIPSPASCRRCAVRSCTTTSASRTSSSTTPPPASSRASSTSATPFTPRSPSTSR